MSNELFPVALYDAGYTDLISVIPPGAMLSPGSKITPSQIGKVPGIRKANGTWTGYNWRGTQATRDDVKAWALHGANVGLRAGNFPGLDIDSGDADIAGEIERLAGSSLGGAPVRVGRWPKRLLMYRTATPFARMRLWIRGPGEEVHLVELLGEGQQYLVHGTHPVTKAPYRWMRPGGEVTPPPSADQLAAITPEEVAGLFDRVTATFEARGYRVSREGDGRRHDAAREPDGDALKAPSDEELAEVVSRIPNTDAQFPTREDYIKMGYAIKAASRDEDAGLATFAEWATRWENPKGNALETVRSDWARMHPPYGVGWEWLAAVARGHGYTNAPEVFTAEGTFTAHETDPPAETNERVRVRLTERWLADQVVERIGGRVRYAAAMGKWLVWDGLRWRADDLQRVVSEVADVLHETASDLASEAKGTEGAAPAAREARRIESARTLFDVLKLVRANRAVVVPAEALDADLWVLNTPAGVVDLRTGLITPAMPEQLNTKITLVGPDLHAAAPLWHAFLKDATAGDTEVESYLQRYAGYCLTGSTREQVVQFIWGKGGNGKGTYLDAVRDVMGNYAVHAAMDTFTASTYDKHSTDLAALAGARLVTASETESGKRWNEQRLKQLSGSDPVTARFMRQDNFTFTPQFKLLFIGNEAPQIRTIDPAIRRRLHLVGFTHEPPVVDLELKEKLKAEYPAILAWMIRGALAWQTRGSLDPPAAVQAVTAAYFEGEDTIGRWLEEMCVTRSDVATPTSALFESWREWANASGEYAGSAKRLVQGLLARGFRKRREGATGRAVFEGIELRPVTWEGA